MEQKDYRLAAIMYTDIAGFSRMMESDEAGTLELLRYHNELIGGIVTAHHGTVIKTIGDALLVDFKNTVEAMQSALEIQDRLYAHNKEISPGQPLLIRIGVHLGDIYFFENDALGEGINIAARLQSLARPGCICFSQDVYNLVLNKIEFQAQKLGKVSLKNITKEIHAYEITTPNVEFDPDKDKPRPGYRPGSYLGEEGQDGTALSHAPASAHTARASSTKKAGKKDATEKAPAPAAQAEAVPVQPVAGPGPAMVEPPAAPEPAEANRSYSPEGSRQILGEIRKAILQDIKTEGRRLSVDEALDRYGSYGVEASEVIAAMVEDGLLVRSKRPSSPDAPPVPPPGKAFFTADDGSFDPELLGRNIEATVRGIVEGIERGVESSRSPEELERRREHYERHYRDRDMRRVDREDRREERRAMRGEDFSDLPTNKWDSKLKENEEWNPKVEEKSSTMDAYRRQLELKARRKRGGFIGNLTSFLAVNAGLLFVYYTYYPHFLWAWIVVASWGIGVVSSLVSAIRAGAKTREARAMPDLEQDELTVYKKLNRVKDSMAMHTASTFTVPVLLATVNFCYPGGNSFLWFLIPTVAMLIGFFSHLGSYGASRSRLQRNLLESLGIEGGWRNIFKVNRTRKSRGAALGAFDSQYEEAERARTAILAEMKGAPMDADLAPALDSYVGQVKLLAQSANEIDRIIGAIPMGDLAKDKAELARKSELATSASLKDEYRRSIEEIDKQEQSYNELRDQSEVIKLRLASSVNQLKQMRIDMARLKAAGGDSSGGPGNISELKRRTMELSDYLQDLRKGYEEGSKDPYAELEELAKAAEAKKSLPEGGDKA
jgi:class 3 adenylate cyclase